MDRFIKGTIAIVVIILIWMGAVTIQNEMNRIDEGMVLSKEYHPAYTTYYTSNKVTIPVHNPERFSVTISDGTKKYYTRIPESFWMSVDVGDTINIKTMKKK